MQEEKRQIRRVLVRDGSIVERIRCRIMIFLSQQR